MQLTIDIISYMENRVEKSKSSEFTPEQEKPPGTYLYLRSQSEKDGSITYFYKNSPWLGTTLKIKNRIIIAKSPTELKLGDAEVIRIITKNKKQITNVLLQAEKSTEVLEDYLTGADNEWIKVTDFDWSS
ncbi:MAG: hypothetical protein A3D34_02930 [Candidatus Staskawiczbacteria bacterium RIFCSPHIGHO2_02_FULL_33_16]|uniref:Uncharacterized protein n=1 Tax=Candidatus Staskawiczbacteria bacterium RIFCSPHIGHO2_02_FULL_33_16 TaxID=1802204 RepID=A0A1G2HUZ3_9BACT|nr:MAG: hypothetical protein A3D34_02930 [Candidatus Staskawiczbacteria bacterium RIFCSPHIGHO2_02_FULL_33_16]OGZ70170.1 MAG: hypothetical protein A2980_00605 [Candidatus Staskawiczbacteria bacterium RIFCSPLOWO2_01_FULL_33_13]